MLKKIILTTIIFVFSFFAFNFNHIEAASCKYNEGTSLGAFLSNCKPEKVAGKGDYKIDENGGFQTQLLKWIRNISLVLGIFAVGSLVYSGFLLQLSAGDDGKIKKAKDIFKWTLIGFLGLISASGIIVIVVNLIYAIGTN